jgi:hypothetical protein
MAGMEDGVRGGFGHGKLFLKKDRRKNGFGPFDANVFSGKEHDPLPVGAHPGLQKSHDRTDRHTAVQSLPVEEAMKRRAAPPD